MREGREQEGKRGKEREREGKGEREKKRKREGETCRVFLINLEKDPRRNINI